MEIHSSPSVSTPVFPPGLYANVSSVCAVWDVQTPVQGRETPVQGPEAASPHLLLSAQELALPWIFSSSSEITKAVFSNNMELGFTLQFYISATENERLCIFGMG